MMRPNRDLLELLLELQAFDRVPRTGYLLRGVPEPESVSEHSWHVVFLVWVLARRISGIDTLRAIEMALVHDLPELRTGDLPRTASGYLPPGAKQGGERNALEDILAPLPARARELWAEFEAGESGEARLVKACDKLQMMLKVSVYESWGAGGLAGFWDNPVNFEDGGFEIVRELYEELKRRR